MGDTEEAGGRGQMGRVRLMVWLPAEDKDWVAEEASRQSSVEQRRYQHDIIRDAIRSYRRQREEGRQKD